MNERPTHILNKCPHCQSPIPRGAKVCGECNEIVKGQTCPDCLSECSPRAKVRKWCNFLFFLGDDEEECPDCLTICKKRAKKCRICGHVLSMRSGFENFDSFVIRADMLATILLRGRFIPEQIEFTKDKIVVSTKGVFGLSVQLEEIPWQKIAGFNYLSGIFWDAVGIETRGQTGSVVGCLSKSDGQRVREVLQALEL